MRKLWSRDGVSSSVVDVEVGGGVVEVDGGAVEEGGDAVEEGVEGVAEEGGGDAVKDGKTPTVLHEMHMKTIDTVAGTQSACLTTCYFSE